MRILVTGASGSGTSTLAAALAQALDGVHLDADHYYWLPTSPPFKARRDPAQRLSLLRADLAAHERVVVAGSLVGWGADVEHGFDLIVFLTLDAAIRVERLRERETRLLGHADPEFLAWAAQYDEGPAAGRSLATHRAWLATRGCPVVELHGDLPVDRRLAAVLQAAAGRAADLSRHGMPARAHAAEPPCASSG